MPQPAYAVELISADIAPASTSFFRNMFSSLFSVLMRLAITHLICDCQNFRQVENELSLIHTLTCLSIKQMTVLNWHLDRNVVSDFGAEVLIGFHANQRAVDAD